MVKYDKEIRFNSLFYQSIFITPEGSTATYMYTYKTYKSKKMFKTHKIIFCQSKV